MFLQFYCVKRPEQLRKKLFIKSWEKIQFKVGQQHANTINSISKYHIPELLNQRVAAGTV